jgi:hypothetical protein
MTRRLRRACIGVAAAVAATLAPADAAVPPPSPPATVTGDQILARLSDPVAAATTSLPAASRVFQVSSREREGGNRDWGVYTREPERPRTFVGQDDEGFVLLDEQRPGCLTRMFFTAGSPVGDISGLGHIQLLFDGEQEPRVDVPATDFFAGRLPGFPQPLVGDSNTSSGGFYSMVPFCYRQGLTVRITQMPTDRDGERLWYQLTAVSFPHGTPVSTYQPGGLRTADAAAALQAAGAPPAGPRNVTNQVVSPGSTFEVFSAAGAGSLRHLGFMVAPFTEDTLSQLELAVTVDGAADPQIAVPLDVLFGDGLGVRPLRSVAFGMDPAAGTGYFALPIPFTDGITAVVRSRTAAVVRVQAWARDGLPGAGVLHAIPHTERSQRGLDATVLAAAGSGRLAALVLDLVGPPGSNAGPIQFMLEGDERVYVDRSPSPSIHGTGTEDMFNGGFYYNRGPFTLPTHGAGAFLFWDGNRAARSQYRIFGDDGVRWEEGLRFKIEHGGGDENDDQLTTSTPFWYAAPAGLRLTDSIEPADPASQKAHRMHGSMNIRSLTAYYEGERDGNAVTSTDPLLFGGAEYPAPPPEQSPESVSAQGIFFDGPLSFDTQLARDNCGAMLRLLVDGASRNEVQLTVDGQHRGTWSIREPNTSKRWRSDDVGLLANDTRGKKKVRVTLTPTAGGATLYGLQTRSRVACLPPQDTPADQPSSTADGASRTTPAGPVVTAPRLPATGAAPHLALIGIACALAAAMAARRSAGRAVAQF